MKKYNRTAFTLIELLLVLVILAALATVVIPKFTGRGEQARVTAAQSDIANMEVALDAYEIDTGSYPSTTDGLRSLMEEPTNTTGWKGPYLRRTSYKDPWGYDYVYQYPGQYNEYGYDLYSVGPDGQFDTEDDIKNWSDDYDRR